LVATTVDIGLAVVSDAIGTAVDRLAEAVEAEVVEAVVVLTTPLVDAAPYAGQSATVDVALVVVLNPINARSGRTPAVGAGPPCAVAVGAAELIVATLRAVGAATVGVGLVAVLPAVLAGRNRLTEPVHTEIPQTIAGRAAGLSFSARGTHGPATVDIALVVVLYAVAAARIDVGIDRVDEHVVDDHPLRPLEHDICAGKRDEQEGDE